MRELFADLPEAIETTAEIAKRCGIRSTKHKPILPNFGDGSRSEIDELKLQAKEGLEARLAAAPAPTSRLRILNPFDSVIRERNRLKRLFGFDYTVEMFVPAAKRQWGYYVYPLLEGDRFVGRIDMKADRKAGTLRIINLWKEPKVQWTPARAAKLDAELARMMRFVQLEQLIWDCDAL